MTSERPGTAASPATPQSIVAAAQSFHESATGFLSEVRTRMHTAFAEYEACVAALSGECDVEKVRQAVQTSFKTIEGFFVDFENEMERKLGGFVIAGAREELWKLQALTEDAFRKYESRKRDTARAKLALKATKLKRAHKICANQVRDLTGTDGAFVVVFDFSDEDLFGTKAPPTFLKPGVCVGHVTVCAGEWSAERSSGSDLQRNKITGFGYVRAQEPLPSGWHLRALKDAELCEQLFDRNAIKRVAGSGVGEYAWFRDCDGMKGEWSASAIKWRVFYDANAFVGEEGPVDPEDPVGPVDPDETDNEWTREEKKNKNKGKGKRKADGVGMAAPAAQDASSVTGAEPAALHTEPAHASEQESASAPAPQLSQHHDPDESAAVKGAHETEDTPPPNKKQRAAEASPEL